jgi:hypothetical protein
MPNYKTLKPKLSCTCRDVPTFLSGFGSVFDLFQDHVPDREVIFYTNVWEQLCMDAQAIQRDAKIVLGDYETALKNIGT